jgi:hypothetical protein
MARKLRALVTLIQHYRPSVRARVRASLEVMPK